MEERKVIIMAKEFFKNLSDTSTPLNASRLNGLLNGSESMGKIMVEDVKCKNLFNINALTLGTLNSNIDYNTETITVNQYANGSYQTLKALAPDLVAGETYTLSLKTTGNNPFIYLEGSNSVWMSGNSRVLTQAEIDDTIIVYGEHQSTATVYISEIQIEEGTTATEYTPYKAFGATSGSNENGSWIKYDDGTMKQWGAGVFSSGGTYENDSWVTVTFPQRFIGDKNSYSYKPVYMSGTADPINACMEMNLTGSRSYGEGNAYVDRDVVYRRLSNANPDGAEQLELFKIPSKFVWEAIGRWK